MRRALGQYGHEVACEALLLGVFMLSACTFTVLLEHPASPMRRGISSPFVRRVLMGLAMGSTAVALIHSPWGRRSGAHMNPAITLSFAVLRKVRWKVALLYAVAQAAGAIVGVLTARLLLGRALAHPSTHYAVTQPGPAGSGAAFAAEFLISFVLMAVVLALSRSRYERYAGLAAGLLVWIYIAIESPISGMSMNPARSLGSALVARDVASLWIYFSAPPFGMLVAAAMLAAGRSRGCAKLDHSAPHCLFCGKGSA